MSEVNGRVLEAIGRQGKAQGGLELRRLWVFFLTLVVCCVVLLGPHLAWAVPAEADLVVLNRPIIRFRGVLFGVQPAMRAERAQQAMSEALRTNIDTLEVRKNEIGNVVLAGGRLAFVITPDDVDKLENQTIEQLTTETTRRLRQVMVESREARDTKALAEGGLHALIATLVMLTLFGLLAALRRRALPRLVRLLGPQEEARKNEFHAIWLERAASLVTFLLRTIFWGANFAIFYVWLDIVLRKFPYTRAWGEQLNAYLINLMLGLANGIVRQIPNLITAAAMFLVAFGISRSIRPFLQRIEHGAGGFSWLDRETVRPTRQILNILIWIFALVMAYPYLPGAQTEAFKGVSVLVGLMVSLGASSVVGQAASGLILMYSRSVRMGDYVKVGEFEGTVTNVGMFLTRIRTGRGSEVTLPNSMILSTASVNYSRVDQASFAIDTTVTIGYDTPWRQVEAMLVEAARRTASVVEAPAPRVFQTALSDFYPEYCLVCASHLGTPRARAEILSELHRNIQDVFNQYGVQIMSPHYLADPKSAKVVPPEQWSPAPATKRET